MNETTATPPVETYYDVLALKPKATGTEVDIAFRRYVARYRPTTPTEQLLTDARFIKHLNAYLTLRGELRREHDLLIRHTPAEGEHIILPTPWQELDTQQQTLLLAQIALWRREHIDGIHLLRTLLNDKPDIIEGWGLLGEFFFTLDRLDEGIQAYERAVALDPENMRYAQRLQQARSAQAGETELTIELSPEEEMRREEQRQRRGVMSAIIALGGVTLLASYFTQVHPMPDAFYVPWWTVATQALGLFTVFLGLAYGRLIQPFEQAMLWSSLTAGDRGYMRSYPYGLLMLVTAVPSMWLASVTLLIIAFMDDEWPVAPSILMGACILVNALLVLKMFFITGHAHWTGTMLVGGNALVLAAMLGWWFGSLGTSGHS